MAIIYFLGESVESGIRVKKETAEELVLESGGMIQMIIEE